MVLFSVTLRGEFPWDMLRYDRCFPASENQSYLLNKRELRTIELHGPILPTSERWYSFGVESVKVLHDNR